jgi:hypothetical protein
MSALVKLRLKIPGLVSPFTSLQVAGRAGRSTVESRTTPAHCRKEQRQFWREREDSNRKAAAKNSTGQSRGTVHEAEACDDALLWLLLGCYLRKGPLLPCLLISSPDRQSLHLALYLGYRIGYRVNGLNPNSPSCRYHTRTGNLPKS